MMPALASKQLKNMKKEYPSQLELCPPNMSIQKDTIQSHQLHNQAYRMAAPMYIVETYSE